MLRRTGFRKFFLPLLCVLLWSCTPEIETDIFIPVDYVGIPSGLTVAGRAEKGFEVRVRGTKSVIDSLSGQDLKYPLDLSGTEIGINTIQINKDHIKLPEKIEIISLNPSFFAIHIEKEVKKHLPVTVTVLGRPAAGYIVADTSSEPSSVVLRGPESIISKIDKISTRPIDVSGFSESFNKETALDVPEGLSILSLHNIFIVKISIKERVVKRKFHDIPVECKNAVYLYSITPPEISIEVKGPVNIIEKLSNKSGIEVYVDLKDLKPGVYVKRASIILPVKTTLVGAAPEIFTIRILKAKRRSE